MTVAMYQEGLANGCGTGPASCRRRSLLPPLLLCAAYTNAHFLTRSLAHPGGYRCTRSSGGVADDDEACADAEYPAACAGSCEQADECNEACDVTKAYFTTSITDESGIRF